MVLLAGCFRGVLPRCQLLLLRFRQVVGFNHQRRQNVQAEPPHDHKKRDEVGAHLFVLWYMHVCVLFCNGLHQVKTY
jgi:hypothetical protein